jgi:hypothetical protein
LPAGQHRPRARVVAERDLDLAVDRTGNGCQPIFRRSAGAQAFGQRHQCAATQ